MKLTQDAADHIAPPQDRYRIFWDDDLAGFGLRVTPTGAKTWVCQWRPFPGGRNILIKRLSICPHGPGIADYARGIAEEKLGAVVKKREQARLKWLKDATE